MNYQSLEYNKKNNSFSSAQDDSFEKFIKNFDITLLFFVLKNMTDEDHAMSIPELSQKLSDFFPMDVNRAQENIEKRREQYSSPEDKQKKVRNTDFSLFPAKTLRTKINGILRMYSSDDPFVMNATKLLTIMMGGSIDYTEAAGIRSGRNKNGVGSQKRLFFQPILSNSDIELVCGTIQSNSYLSQAEKDYLLARIHLLNPISNFTNKDFTDAKSKDLYDLNCLPEKPTPSKKPTLPVDSHKLLTHISAIYEAINNKYQIEVVYGTYDISSVSSHLDFHAREENKTYILNPYALFCHRGEYYLIASNQKYKNPTHFRVDRMIQVKPCTTNTEDGLRAYVPRAEVPELLAPYFIKKKNHEEFDYQKYVATYPGMRIFGNERKVDCCFECTPWSLQILVDTFGTGIRIGTSPIPHKEDELDYNGRPQEYLTATVEGVQYDNAHKFCIEQHEYLTLLSPTELVSDVRTSLQKSLDRYQAYNH